MGLVIKTAITMILAIAIHSSSIAAALPDNPDLRENIRIRYEDPFIWLTAMEVDAIILLEAVSNKIHRKIKIINKQDPPIKKQISITLEKVTVDMAVKNICRMLGLSYAIIYDKKNTQTYCLFHPGGEQLALSPANHPFPPPTHLQKSSSNPFSFLEKIQQQEDALPENITPEEDVDTQDANQTNPEATEKTEPHLQDETENITMDESAPGSLPGAASTEDTEEEEEEEEESPVDLPPGTFATPSSDQTKKPYFPFRTN